MMNDEHTIETVLAAVKAVADESRVRILLCLDGQPLCLDHLVRILDLAPSTVSGHLRQLADAGLVEVRREGHWRFYQLATPRANDPGCELVAWLRRHCAAAERLAEDRGRRLVALGDSDAPVPSFLKPNVLFLCTGNSCRSQMAEGLLRARAGERFEIHSAGLEPRDIPELTVAVMAEIGIDIGTQRPKDVRTYLGHLPIEYLITVCPNAESRCPVFPGARHRLYWPTPDPADGQGERSERLAGFRRARDLMDERVGEWLRSLDEENAPTAAGSGVAAARRSVPGGSRC